MISRLPFNMSKKQQNIKTFTKHDFVADVESLFPEWNFQKSGRLIFGKYT